METLEAFYERYRAGMESVRDLQELDQFFGLPWMVITPDGEIAIRQTHEINNGRPQLQGDESGKFRVVGGLRLPSDNDLPALKLIETDAAPQTP